MVWNASCIGYAQSVQIHPIMKAKTRKRRRKTKRRKENGRILSSIGTHGRAWQGHGRAPGPHGQPLVGSIPPSPFAFSTLHFVLFWCFYLGRGFCLCSVIFGLLCKLLWCTWPSRFILSSITWLITCKSAIKTRKSRNNCNWRNRGINYK